MHIESCSVKSVCDPMDYRVHGVLQAGILEWIAILFVRGSSQPRDRTQVSLIAGEFFTSWATMMSNSLYIPLTWSLKPPFYLLILWIWPKQNFNNEISVRKKKKEVRTFTQYGWEYFWAKGQLETWNSSLLCCDSSEILIISALENHCVSFNF